MLVGAGRRALIGEQRLVDDFPHQIVDDVLDSRLRFRRLKTDFVSQLDGRQFIGAWATGPQAGWAVLSRQPLAVAQRVERRMWRQSWWAVGGALALIVLASVFAYLSVVRPIRQVAAAQRRLAGLPAGGGGGNEIGQLRAAFAALERRISDQERLDEVFLGRYQVSDVIGSGAMGTVFKGWDPKLKRPVALKTVRLDTKLKGKQRQELVERLLSEAVTVARFNHPNIVGVFDVEDHPEGAYVAMELVDGNSLEQSIWRGRRMPPAQVVPLGAAIARALAAAHQHGIVHRDIKPANVLLGIDGSIKVTDFGISELLSSLAPSEDVVFGTPGFVPPETLRGKGYDQAGDLFSMGAVLYTCLVGRPPFDGKSVKEVIRRTLFGVVEPPGKLVPDVPPELDELIMALLSREPGQAALGCGAGGRAARGAGAPPGLPLADAAGRGRAGRAAEASAPGVALAADGAARRQPELLKGSRREPAQASAGRAEGRSLQRAAVARQLSRRRVAQRIDRLDRQGEDPGLRLVDPQLQPRSTPAPASRTWIRRPRRPRAPPGGEQRRAVRRPHQQLRVGGAGAHRGRRRRQAVAGARDLAGGLRPFGDQRVPPLPVDRDLEPVPCPVAASAAAPCAPSRTG